MTTLHHVECCRAWVVKYLCVSSIIKEFQKYILAGLVRAYVMPALGDWCFVKYYRLINRLEVKFVAIINQILVDTHTTAKNFGVGCGSLSVVVVFGMLYLIKCHDGTIQFFVTRMEHVVLLILELKTSVASFRSHLPSQLWICLTVLLLLAIPGRQ